MRTREPRRKVMIPARMRAGGPTIDVLIRDVSSRGLMLTCAPLPPRGAYVDIERQRLAIVGRVVWVADGRCGIRTREPIDQIGLIGSMAGPEAAEDLARPTPALSPAKRPAADRFGRFGAILQFAALVGFGGAAAIGLAMTVSDALARPVAAVSTHLRVAG